MGLMHGATRGRKTANRATGLEMALAGILEKGVVWYGEGLENRSTGL